MNFKLYNNECLDVLMTLPSGSIDAVVADPPYGLSFMGRKWDYDVPSEEIWAECLRVLKPGGHLLAFAGTRTQHRMAVRIEDAGFEIRDMIAWVYGSGFPKSKNLEGEREGWGTALKPAMEPITVARKPLAGKTVAENVLVHGTGALNIDGCRVATDESLNGGAYAAERQESASEWAKSGSLHKTTGKEFVQPSGRWPANLIHDGSEEVVAGFPDAPGQQRAVGPEHGPKPSVHCYGDMGARPHAPPRIDADKSAARFFYCAKASKSDRGEGNNHPTVKPTELMRYLCRLVTPPGGIVLDPFMGSGSTGKAAIQEGFRFIGIERDVEYFKIAERRFGG